MTAKTIQYFGRWYHFSSDAIADAASTAISNVGSGAVSAALIDASVDDSGAYPVKLLITAGADVVLIGYDV